MVPNFFGAKTQRHLVAVRLLNYKCLEVLNKEKRSMTAFVARFVYEESGQDLIEYGLLIGIITTAALIAINEVAPKVAGYYSSLNADLP
jgi:Flp pilus assembly pilin Flp